MLTVNEPRHFAWGDSIGDVQASVGRQQGHEALVLGLDARLQFPRREAAQGTDRGETESETET